MPGQGEWIGREGPEPAAARPFYSADSLIQGANGFTPFLADCMEGDLPGSDRPPPIVAVPPYRNWYAHG